MLEPARHLIFHGAIVLLIGLVCGAPYARAIKRNAPAHTVHAWRVAHASLPIGAGLMLAAAASMPLLSVGPGLLWGVALSLIVSSYAFCISLPLGAVVEHRGLSSEGPWQAKAVYAGNMVGAWSSLVGAVLLVVAGYLSL